MKSRFKEKSKDMQIGSVASATVENDGALACADAAVNQNSDFFAVPDSGTLASSNECAIARSSGELAAVEGSATCPRAEGSERESVNRGGIRRIAIEEAKKQALRVQSALAKKDKKVSALTKVSAVWTVLSTLYAIASTCIMIARGWVSGAVSYVLISVLAVYVAVFIALVVMIFRNPKSGVKNAKIYKKLLKIFKATAHIAFLVLTAITLAGITKVDFGGVMKWIVCVASIIIATVQIGLNATLLVLRIIRNAIAKRFKVEIVNFVDGKLKNKSALAKLEEKKYLE